MFDFTDFIKEIVTDPAPGERFEPPFGFFLFDKRMLQPLAWHVGAVKGETGEVVSEEQPLRMADSGLIPLLEGPWLEPGQRGAPIYTPSRVGMLLKLQRQGFEAAELHDVVEREEFYIDEFLTSDEWRYDDKDLNLLLRYAESERTSPSLRLIPAAAIQPTQSGGARA